MKTNTTAPRRVARSIAVVLWMIGSAYLVNAELANPAPNWVVIAATPPLWAAVIALPVMAGHAWADRQWTATVLLTLSALIGSLYMLTGTLGRQAEARDTRHAEAQITAERRTKLQAQLDGVEGILASSRERMAKECASGAGKNCTGIKTVIELSEPAAAKHRADIAKLKSIAPDAGERRIAAALALITGRSEAQMRSIVGDLLPALFGVLVELAALACAKYGWSANRPAELSGQSSDRPAPVTTANCAQVAPKGDGGQPRPHPRPDGSPDGRRDQVLASLLTDLGLGRSAPSQRDLCERFGIPRSTMSDWLGEWERSGIIPARRTVGRCKALVAA